MDLAIFLILPWAATVPIYFLRRIRLLMTGLSLGVLAAQAWVLWHTPLDRQTAFLGMEMALDAPARALLLLMLGVTAFLVVFVWRAAPDDLLPVFGPALVALAGAALLAQATVVAGALLILLAAAVLLLIPRSGDAAAAALKPLVVAAPAFTCFVLNAGWEQTYQLNPDFTYLLPRMAAVWGLAFAAILAVTPFHLVTPELGRGRMTGLVYALALVDGVALIQATRLLGSRPWLPPLAMPWLLALGAFMALTGGVLALGQKQVGRMVAYSAIADLGCLLVGLGAATTLGLTGAVIQAGSRVLALTLLAVSATNLRRYAPGDSLDELHGLARALPWTTWGFIVGALALAGLPPTLGFVGRLMTLEAAQGLDLRLLVALLVGMAGATLAAVRVVGALFSGPRRPAGHGEPGGFLILALTLVVVFLGVYPNPLLETVRDVVQRLARFGG